MRHGLRKQALLRTPSRSGRFCHSRCCQTGSGGWHLSLAEREMGAGSSTIPTRIVTSGFLEETSRQWRSKWPPPQEGSPLMLLGFARKAGFRVAQGHTVTGPFNSFTTSLSSSGRKSRWSPIRWHNIVNNDGDYIADSIICWIEKWRKNVEHPKALLPHWHLTYVYVPFNNCILHKCLSFTCLSLYGLKSMSWRMMWLADVKLMPNPPARVERRNTDTSVLLLKSLIISCLKEIITNGNEKETHAASSVPIHDGRRAIKTPERVLPYPHVHFENVEHWGELREYQHLVPLKMERNTSANKNRWNQSRVNWQCYLWNNLRQQLIKYSALPWLQRQIFAKQVFLRTAELFAQLMYLEIWLIGQVLSNILPLLFLIRFFLNKYNKIKMFCFRLNHFNARFTLPMEVKQADNMGLMVTSS